MNGSRGLGSARLLLVYGLMLALGVAAFFVIRAYGESMVGESGARDIEAPIHAPPPDVLLHVLLALAAIIVAGRTLAYLLTWVGQPPVIGEVIAGILLGPSFLGRISPDAMTFLLPPEVLPYLGVLAQLGVILYMFLVGLDLNAEFLRSRAQAALAISHASIVVPFLLGAGLALWLHRALGPAGVPFTSFALFMGVAMAITAFPVLARILTDRRIDKTELGVLALSCAAADDITAWCLLALSVGVAQAHVSGAIGTAVLAVGYIVLMLVAVRPVAARWVRGFQDDHVPPIAILVVLVALLASALATEAIGVHAIFGAFLLGAIIPHDSALARAFRAKLEDVVSILLLPAFFAYTGMRTQIGLIAGLDQWLMCAAIILVATVGKFGGTFLAARLTGLDNHVAAALGILMNTRGLMELIVLNIGLDLGVISPTLYAMMVLMALVTTLATMPVLHWLNGKASHPIPTV